MKHVHFFACLAAASLFASSALAADRVVVIPMGGRDVAPPASYPAPVAKTGQTTSYAPGDDGDLEKGVALPQPRFTDNGDGTVTDNRSGLIWLKKANCIQTDYPTFDNDSTAGDGRVTWQHALDFVNGINAGTYNCGDTSNNGLQQTDWRLANMVELPSLFHLSYFNPMLSNVAGAAKWSEGDPFTGVATANFYWTSTTTPAIDTMAFTVDFWVGDITAKGKTSAYFVWPVRGGE